MMQVTGSWRMFVLYGAISVGLFLLFHFQVIGGPAHPDRSASVRAAARQAQASGERADRFNACLKRAHTNLKKVHACQAEHDR
jgi:hypothetical protein